MEKNLRRTRFGPVSVIFGEPSSVFPNCTSLYVDGLTERAVIDPGAGPEALKAFAGRVDLVVNTHYHFDHIWGNHFFRGSPVLLNEVEKNCFPDLEEVGSRLGIREVYGDEGVKDWIDKLARTGGVAASRRGGGVTPRAPHSPAYRPEWWLSTRTPARSYPYGEFNVGSVRAVMVHTPGHTAGLACPFFPDEGLVYTADIDLTRFGPWYAGTDGDMDAFAVSARALLALDADWYLTGHQEGLVRKADFAQRLEDYLGVIGERDRRALEVLGNGASEEELLREGLLYGSRYHADPWIYMWDLVATRKHIERLRQKGVLQT